MHLEDQLRSLLKGEFSSLNISFNDHACNYCSAADGVLYGSYDHVDWVSEEEKARAIQTNSVWVLHWYPNSPVGFNAVAASTLATCISAALTGDEHAG